MALLTSKDLKSLGLDPTVDVGSRRGRRSKYSENINAIRSMKKGEQLFFQFADKKKDGTIIGFRNALKLRDITPKSGEYKFGTYPDRPEIFIIKRVK